MLFFLLLSLFLFSPSFSSPTLSATVRCNPSDKNALLAFQKFLYIPSDLPSWDLRTDCCKWTYVHCDPLTNRVTQLVITSINTGQFPVARGPIPAAVGDLPYLETLSFNDIINLTGSIPYSITKLQNLKRLVISGTTLSSSIPEFLGQLKNLEYLDLSANELFGSIPASLGNLGRLVSLELQSNKLTGKIPNSLGRLNPEAIVLSDNKLSGDASMLFSADGRARWINLSGNRLEFDLSKVMFQRNLTFLSLSYNRIGGSIPEQVTELNLIQVFDVSYNRLCGKIPVGGRLQQLGAPPFLHNRCLCGPPLFKKCKA
ncbi:PREDICTED: polygalacturonase inhibitor-like [Nelumbo nucifera]|uniref:Leucine-rich repeat-containing N-terminal plant-type domain-containing protein n=2 Tax=Nelumbo nucifera TaxID=4432 RepID=A0A822YFZ2_NELNU|nr:PREDICTED: polygalacturonase inhibitor-like [Nelumbo nucifera]DAD29906.1 TPA_asm: hypothetical protein HUJ06_031374 [Nelumbo nucifera]